MDIRNFELKFFLNEILSYTFLDRAGAEFVQTTNANLSEDQALALALAQSESEAKKREEESRNRVVDAAASWAKILNLVNLGRIYSLSLIPNFSSRFVDLKTAVVVHTNLRPDVKQIHVNKSLKLWQFRHHSTYYESYSCVLFSYNL